MVVFTSFGFLQLANQISESGPEWFWAGELTYCFLPLFSKGLLGGILLFNVLMYQSFDEAVVESA